MAIDVAALAVRIESNEAKLRKLDKGLQSVDKSGKGAGASIQQLKGALGALGVGLGIAAVGKALKSVMAEAIAAEKVWTGLRITVENAGASFADLAPEIQALTDSLQETTQFAGDTGAKALTELTRILGDTGKAMGALSITADVAAATGLDLGKAAQFTGRVLAGETTVLKRYGIVVGENETAMEALRRSVGGFAEEQAKTLGGQLAQMGNAFDDLKREIGFALNDTDAMTDTTAGLREALEDATNWVVRNAGAIGAWVHVIRESVGLAIRLIGLFATTIKSQFKIVGDILGNIGALIVGVFTFDLGLIKTSLVEIKNSFIANTQRIRDALTETAEAVLALGEALGVAAAGGDPTRSRPRGMAGRAATGSQGAKVSQGKTAFLPLAGEGPLAFVDSRTLRANLDAKIAEIRATVQVAQQSLEDMALQFEMNLRQTFADAIYNGFAAAFDGQGLSGLLDAFVKTMLTGIGHAMVELGTQFIITGKAIEAFKLAVKFLAGGAAIATGVGLIGVGAALIAAGSAGGQPGRGTAEARSFREPRFPGIPTDITSQTVPLGASLQLQPVASIHIGPVIGVNDPAAQRAIAAMVRAAVLRGIRIA